MQFKIQRFAEGEGAEGQAQQPVADVNEVVESTEEQTVETKPEIDIESKIVETVNKALKGFEDMLKKREAAARKEAERLSKLSDEERQKAEIENGRKELEIKEKELQRKELMLEMTKVLAERKIPVQFMEYLIADDNESTLDRIKTFEREYKSAIETAVTEKLKGKAPSSSGGGKITVGSNPRVKDGFMKAITDNQVRRGN